MRSCRRYEGIDAKRTDELTRKVGESLTPRPRKLDGFSGYYLIEAENGVMSSVNFYDTSAHADESTRVVAEWLREEKLDRSFRIRPRSRAERSSSRRCGPARNSPARRDAREGAALAGLLYSLYEVERRVRDRGRTLDRV